MRALFFPHEPFQSTLPGGEVDACEHEPIDHELTPASYEILCDPYASGLDDPGREPLDCGCLRHRIATLSRDDRGMTTLEYALGALTAMAIAAALYLVVNSGVVSDGLRSIITDALSNRP
ncbi:hypothetical protein B843_01565 [Corynebacterium vitaeruminis DSM 20294]|uniref:DUF4244 domain-containing protein n=1 Tax=Corynebacterium vitaeruminis DSM 20294 TaxID=1224164 RepID=W5XYE2_9CORY|nr:hypothetical protein B843_01565 [Corynebacterium vitaeruminis DSM 20294]